MSINTTNYTKIPRWNLPTIEYYKPQKAPIYDLMNGQYAGYKEIAVLIMLFAKAVANLVKLKIFNPGIAVANAGIYCLNAVGSFAGRKIPFTPSIHI